MSQHCFGQVCLLPRPRLCASARQIVRRHTSSVDLKQRVQCVETLTQACCLLLCNIMAGVWGYFIQICLTVPFLLTVAMLAPAPRYAAQCIANGYCTRLCKRSRCKSFALTAEAEAQADHAKCAGSSVA